MLELSIDIETYSATDIKTGVYRYVEDPTFEVLLIAYHFSDDPNETPALIDLVEAGLAKGPVSLARCAVQLPEHARFFKALTDPQVVNTAFNANFERICLGAWSAQLMHPEQWRCTRVLAASLGLPHSLEKVGVALHLDADKQKMREGKDLIRYFCMPCKPTKSNGGRTRNRPEDAPDKWSTFKDYCVRDVVTERTIRNKLIRWAPNASEQALWNLDQEINDRGIPVDINMVRNIVAYDEQHVAQLKNKMREITGLDNPGSVQQLIPWINERLQGLSYQCDSLAKAKVTDLLQHPDLPDEIRQVLGLRQATSKTSTKKYQTMLDCTNQDGRVRGTMQFYGGHTGRWSGQRLQVQNLKRNDLSADELDYARQCFVTNDTAAFEKRFAGRETDVISQLVRTALIPTKGRQFVVTDFSAIEARVLAWLAGEEWRLDVFRKGGDIYCESASQMFGVPVEKHGVNGHLRAQGKVAELACGYGGGKGAMAAMDFRHEIPEEEYQVIVDKWRSASPHVVQMWRDFERAARLALNNKDGAKFDTGYPNRPGIRHVTFHLERLDTATDKLRLLVMTLPSGRPIYYWDARLSPSARGFGDTIHFFSPKNTAAPYEEQFVDTFGGRLVENCAQSIARDILGDKMKQMAQERDDYLAPCFPIVFHVHDEMILDVPLSYDDPETRVDDIMAEPVDWAPDLPLKGGTYTCSYYMKD